MSDDLLGVLTGGKETLQGSVDPVDYLVRTVYGEADPNDPASRQAVAAVIKNRADKSGKGFDQVVQEPGQFEPWSDPKARARMLALTPDSPDYQAILKDVQPVLNGQVTLPYTNFYSPSVLKARGEQPPGFDNGSGKQIGSQLFFAGDVAEPDLAGALGGGKVSDADAESAYAKAFGEGGAGAAGASGAPAADLGPATVKTENGKIVFGDTGQPVPAAQVKTITTLAQGGKFSADASPGSVNLPWVQRNPNDTFKPGDFYIEAGTGQLRQEPGGPAPENAGFGGGFVAGLGDVPNSLLKLFPAGQGSDVLNAMEANRLVYDATHQGDRSAQLGRFTGQVAASAPLLAGGEGALGGLAARAPEAAAPFLDFLAGNAGRASAEQGGNLLLRGGSLAARGAGEGAGASLLTSGASDRPLGEQLLTGAATGALLAPVIVDGAPQLGAAANRLLSGSPVSPAVASLARTAVDKYGIPLRVSQIQGAADRGAAIRDSEMIARGGTGYAQNQADQLRAFTRSIAATFGEDADKLTPEIMSHAKERIGAEFDRVAQSTTINDTNALALNLDKVVSEAQQVLPESDVAPLVKQVENIRSAIKDGSLSGESYQALTRRGSPLDRATESANPNIRHYAQELKGVLDDALAASASDADRQALTQARFQYKNLMTVKNLAAKASVEGEISPRLLNGAVNTSFRNRAFTGAGDLGELAQIGQTFLKEPGNSQTAPRLAARLKDLALGAGGLGEGILLFHDPGTALKLAAAAAGAASLRYGKNALEGAYNRSPSAVNRLIENARANSGQASPAAQIAQRLGQIGQPAFVPMGAITANNLLSPPR